jgi:addiction module RelE/StbE family toxin
MEEYSVKISPSAQEDLLDIIGRIGALTSEEVARYFDVFVEKITVLSTIPESCPLARDSQLRLRGYRTLPLENYIVFYVIDNKNVELRRILYARRQYERLIW